MFKQSLTNKWVNAKNKNKRQSDVSKHNQHLKFTSYRMCLLTYQWSGFDYKSDFAWFSLLKAFQTPDVIKGYFPSKKKSHFMKRLQVSDATRDNLDLELKLKLNQPPSTSSTWKSLCWDTHLSKISFSVTMSRWVKGASSRYRSASLYTALREKTHREQKGGKKTVECVKIQLIILI